MRLRMREMMIAVIAAVAVISAQVARVAADDSPIARELWRDLVEKRRLPARAIASVLTYWGGNGTPETRLVRWRDGPNRLVIVLVGDAKDEAGRLVEIMRDALSAIGRRGEFCTQTVNLSGDGTYSPSLGSFECMQDPSDVLVVVDAASSVSTKLLQDLDVRSKAANEESAWGGPAKMKSDYFTETSCGAIVTVDGNSNRITSGSVYLHVVTQGEKNIESLDECVHALPFFVLGLFPPFPTRGPLAAFNRRLLQMLYSPELHPGMTHSEIEKLLESSAP